MNNLLANGFVVDCVEGEFTENGSPACGYTPTPGGNKVQINDKPLAFCPQEARTFLHELLHGPGDMLHAYIPGAPQVQLYPIDRVYACDVACGGHASACEDNQVNINFCR